MKNVLRVFARDVKRLFKAPAALVVVLFLIVLPSLYTWFNVVGFWDPYGNTSNLKVCVVNEDVGAHTELAGDLDVGDQVVDKLHDNTQLGWEFTDYDTAMDEVESGRAYAAFVIPRDFSQDFASLLTGNVQQPQLIYYVNEKAGAVSPKITDTGATTLDESINSAFVSTASEVAADMLNGKLADAQTSFNTSKSEVTTQFKNAQASVTEARQAIAGLNDANATAIQKTHDAEDKLQQAKGTILLISDQMERISSLTTTTENDLSAFSLRLMSAMDQSSATASQASVKTNAAIGSVTGAVTQAQAEIDAAITVGQDAVAQNTAAITQLKALQQSLPDSDPEKARIGQLIDNLNNQNTQLQQALSSMQTTSQDTKNAATAIASASDAANTSVQTTLDNAAAYRNTLSESTLPAINSGLTQLSGTASSLSTAVSNQTLLIDQTSSVLSQLDSTLQTTTSALGQTDTLLGDLSSDLGTVQADIAAIGTSDAISQLFDNGTIDASRVAEFMLSPAQLQTETLYPLNAYGSAMAPLFTNLTLWIGVFMLMVILKQEVDDEGIKNLTISQRYLGRWLFLAPIAMLQAVVCCTGNLIIGVQSESVALLYLTAIIASLTYLSLQYALSVTLQYIGKGLCVVLVFVQIPGATGLYPTEMTPAFFQAVYPFFPFTYGINALRETIGGFYGNEWGSLIAMLLVFLVASFVIGLLVRPTLTNVNRMFARQIRESGIFNGEDVQVPQRRYRLGQIIQALSDRDDYKVQLRQRAERFLKWYPRLKAAAWFFGIIVPTVGTLLFSLAGSGKVVVLTAWLIWLVTVMMFLIIIEHIRDSLQRQLALEDLSDDELRSLFSVRGSLRDIAISSANSLRRGRDA